MSEVNNISTSFLRTEYQGREPETDRQRERKKELFGLQTAARHPRRQAPRVSWAAEDSASVGR